MPGAAPALLFCSVLLLACNLTWATSPGLLADPLAAIDLNRNMIIGDIVRGFEAAADKESAATLKARLGKLRADHLFAASLASSRESLEAIIAEGETSQSARVARVSEKALGDANRDLVYTPIAPCRLVDTRGFGAPIQGGPFTPFERRSYAPNGLCSVPTSNVASLMLSITTQNLTPASGGYLTILSPGSPVSVANDVFNLGAEWSSLATSVMTGSAGQFDVFVNQATAQVVVDIVGYFGPPTGGTGGGSGTVTSIATGTGLTGGPITGSGTIAIADSGVGTTQLADGSVTAAKMAANGCASGQVLKYNGTAWACAADNTGTPGGSGTVTGITAGTGLTGGTITTSGTIALASPVAVANGGTGRSTFTSNGLLYGQGTSAIGFTPTGQAGEVLAGTASAPAWTGSPSLSGNITLVASTSSAGNILKSGNRFIHNRGVGNTFIGELAGNFTMTGTGNTGGGYSTLTRNTTGIDNTAGGYQALFFNTSGEANTASGKEALLFNTTGSNNTASGVDALRANVSGAGSTAFGWQALRNATGSGNIAIGSEAGLNVTSGSNNIVIGNDGFAGDAGYIRIGTANVQNRAYIAGVRGVQTQALNAIAVLIDSNGQLGTLNSSRRFKDDIADMDAASAALMKLRPVTFHYKGDQGSPGRALQYGLIAEEVAQVYPGLVAYSRDGQLETVMYQYLPSMLLNEYQKQQRTIEAQARHIERMERTHTAEIAGLKQAVAEIADLKQQMSHMARLLDQQRPDVVTARLGPK